MRHGLKAAAAAGVVFAFFAVPSTEAQVTRSPRDLPVLDSPAAQLPSIDADGKGVADPFAAAQADLRERSETPVYFRVSNGRLTAAEFRIPLKRSGDTVEDALSFLETHAEQLRLPAPRETLYFDRLERHETGETVFFNQHFGGVTVADAQVAVYLEKETATGVSGAWLGEFPAAAAPAVEAREAAAIALAAAGKDHRLAGEPRLFYVDPSLTHEAAQLAEAKQPAGERLAWSVSAQRGGGGAFYSIDAMTGAILLRADAALSAMDFELASALTGNEVWPCWIKRPPGDVFAADAAPWFLETGQVAGAAPDAEGVGANTGLRGVFNTLAGLGRDSWDNRGAYVYAGLDLSAVDGGPVLGPLTDNARYSSFCDNLAFTNNMAMDDVVAHEFGHGVVRHSAGFSSNALPSGAAGQPRSLNEHFSDVYGALVDTADWTLGEGSARGVMRDMADPTSLGAPDRMSVLNMTSIFPHPNANIMNKAAFLIAAGQNFNNVLVTGIGRQKMGRLYHNVLTTRLTSNASFQTLADQAIIAARGFAATGQFGFTNADACSVARAYSAIELDGDVDCDGLRDTADGANDTDLDGRTDTADNCPFAANPSQTDTDRDGAGDACDGDLDNDGRANAMDNCVSTPNSAQQDFNSDGVGDACGDADFDRVLDAADNCRLNQNADQRNTDGDAYGDICDADLDGDGICHALNRFQFSGQTGGPAICPSQEDNCPRISNSAQADADSDGFGDACDQCLAAANTGLDTDGDGTDNACDTDDDNDGVPDASDNCPINANPAQTDIDGDGVGQACDADEAARLNPNGQRVPWEQIMRWRRDRLDRHTIPFACGKGDIGAGLGADASFEVAFESSIPLELAIVDRGGRRLSTFIGSKGAVQIPFGRDLCPLAGFDDKQGLAADGAERYFLDIAPLKRARSSSLLIETQIVPWKPGAPPQ